MKRWIAAAFVLELLVVVLVGRPVAQLITGGTGGSGGGGGSGTVNNGNANSLAGYASTGTAVSDVGTGRGKVGSLGVGVADDSVAGDLEALTSLGVGVAPDTTAGDATINLSLGVGIAAPGTSGEEAVAKALLFSETTAPSGAANKDICYADSTAHAVKCLYNNAAAQQLITTGGDINASNQVTASHLAAALPVAQGGSGTTSAATEFHFPYYACASPNGSGGQTSANQIDFFQIYIPYAVVASHFVLSFQAGDPSNKYDFGLFNSTGALVVNVGAQAIATASYEVLPFAQGTTTFLPGVYYEAFTGNATTGKMGTCVTALNGPVMLYVNNAFASPTTTAGALPTSVTVPTANPITNTGGSGLPYFTMF